MAGRASTRRHLQWHAGIIDRIHCSEPYRIRSRIAESPTSKHVSVQLQPVLALRLWDKWYLRSAEANWSMGWHRHSATMLPLSAGIARALVRPGLPPMSFFVTGQLMEYRQFAPLAPQTTINFGMRMTFPQLWYYWGH
jgi:hypothetical protein